MFGCYTRNKVDNEMPNLTLENIANACEGTYVGDPSKKQKIITGKMEISKADFPCLQRIENINTVC
ncbi:MAG: hypothetical protein BHW45_05260 [Roseburia sp. CAG:197_41_10]|nr:MAG: hypothetical protein BHW45_05260 [Roseburia sp. CAG:197_41_10]